MSCETRILLSKTQLDTLRNEHKPQAAGAYRQLNGMQGPLKQAYRVAVLSRRRLSRLLGLGLEPDHTSTASGVGQAEASDDWDGNAVHHRHLHTGYWNLHKLAFYCTVWGLPVTFCRRC